MPDMDEYLTVVKEMCRRDHAYAVEIERSTGISKRKVAHILSELDIFTGEARDRHAKKWRMIR